MASYAQEYYQKLFTRDREIEMNSAARLLCLSSMPKLVTHTRNMDLDKEITAEGVKTAVKDLPKGKAPGIDIIPAEFFQTCWEDIGPDLVEFIKEVLSQGRLPRKLNTSNIVLLPKTGTIDLFLSSTQYTR